MISSVPTRRAVACDHVTDLMSNHRGKFGIVAIHQHHHAFESPDMPAGQREGVDLITAKDDEIPLSRRAIPCLRGK